MHDRVKNWVGAIALVTFLAAGASMTGQDITGAREPNPATGEIYRLHSRRTGTVYVTHADYVGRYWQGGIAIGALIVLIALRRMGWKPMGDKTKQ